jgi:hypothetical protein
MSLSTFEGGLEFTLRTCGLLKDVLIAQVMVRRLVMVNGNECER